MSATINDLTEYVQLITELNTKTDGGRDKGSFVTVYRGQSNSDYELIPSIARNRRTPIDTSILNQERNLIELAKYKLPDVFRNDLTPIELLALLQHHGIPTRLLDITENALVALFFACGGNDESNGEVFVFMYNDSDVTNLPIINGLAESYKFARYLCYIEDFYENIIEQPYFIESKAKEKYEKDGARWIVNCCDGPIFVHASNSFLYNSKCRRQVSQT